MNKLNNSIDYQGNSLLYIEGDTIADSGTANAGASISYKTLNAKCSVRTGTVYATGSTTENGARATVSFNPADTAVEVTLLSSETGNLTKTLYDSAFANTSTPTGAGTGNEDITESAATAMAQDGTRSGYIKMTQANGSSAYGGPGNPNDPELSDAGILVGIDTVTSSIFKDEDIQAYQQSGISANFRQVSCDKFVNEKAKYSLNTCYVLKAIGSKTEPTVNTVGGDIWIGWTMRASLGNPGASDDPVFYLVPLTWYQDTDTTVKYGGVDRGNTAKGKIPHRVTLDNS